MGMGYGKMGCGGVGGGGGGASERRVTRSKVRPGCANNGGDESL